MTSSACQRSCAHSPVVQGMPSVLPGLASTAAIFSDDVTLDEDYWSVCGCTEANLDEVLGPELCGLDPGGDAH